MLVSRKLVRSPGHARRLYVWNVKVAIQRSSVVDFCWLLRVSDLFLKLYEKYLYIYFAVNSRLGNFSQIHHYRVSTHSNRFMSWCLATDGAISQTLKVTGLVQDWLLKDWLTTPVKLQSFVEMNLPHAIRTHRAWKTRKSWELPRFSIYANVVMKREISP